MKSRKEGMGNWGVKALKLVIGENIIKGEIK
jgi:hypothetical protein